MPDNGGIQYHARGTAAGARAREIEVIECEVPHNVSSVTLLRIALRMRNVTRGCDVMFVEIGRNEGSTLLLALLVSMLSGRKLNVLSHDGTLLVRSLGAYLASRQTRKSKRLGYRVLAPFFSELLRHLFIRRVTLWFVTSDGARDEMQIHGLTPCVVMTHGLEEPVSRILPSQSRAIVVPGFLGVAKGTDVAIDAWLRCNASTDYYLHVIGQTHEGTRVWASNLHRALEKSGRPFKWTVDSAGDSEFQQVIADAAIVVIPYRESNPASGIVVRSVVEGRCIIGSAVPAVLSEIENGTSGVILRHINAENLATAIEELVAAPAQRDEFGANVRKLRGSGRSWADQFDSIARHFK